MKVVNLSEDLELVGVWCLPDNEDDQIPGKLMYSEQNGIRLKLEGQFKVKDFTTVWGIAGGKKITLLNAFSTSFTPFANNFDGYFPTEIIANQMLIGHLFANEDDVLIENAIFETTDIKPWSLLSGFSQNIEQNIENKSFSVNYTLPEPVSIYTDNNVNITINTKVTIPSMYPPSEEIYFKEINFFKISNVGGKSGLTFFSHIDALRKFVSLASRQEIQVNNIRFKIEGSDEYIHCVTRFLNVSLDYKPRKSHSYDMFFTLKGVSELTERYALWYKFLQVAPEPANLYFTKSKGYLHDIFLMKAQALEEVHRQLNPDKRKFGYKSIISYLFEKHKGIMLRVGDKEAFSKLVLDHRDYFTHWFEKKRECVLDAEELSYLAKDVNLLIELCLLEAMGFNEQEIQNMVENCFDYRGYLEIGRPEVESLSPPPRVQWK